VDDHRWGDLLEYLLITLLGLFIGLTTKPVTGKPKNFVELARQYARITGLMIGIGGWFPVLHLLIDILSDHH